MIKAVRSLIIYSNYRARYAYLSVGNSIPLPLLSGSQYFFK